ncbi:MAG: sigma-70 family RNA polymerase sigma factor [Alphaproteobacteria bacterium]|nr:sigma-70 family RNA polymerase sigma factor [Alphaproteobacteria bacterium]
MSAELTRTLLAGLAGDAVAYAAFLNQLSPILRRVIGRKIPASDVEDVLQEVLISIHKARHTYDGNRPLMPWLIAITSFRVTDHLRKTYSEMRHKSVDIADYENLLEAVTENTHESESIDEMLDGIGGRERKILSMMHVEGYTAKQVGEQLGMKESAVKVAAHRAIKKIREKFSHG